MNIAIFGSCVSRDTCEFIPNAHVKTYVARQSVTSLIRPHGSKSIDVRHLQSSFQQRMVMNDLDGSGSTEICKHAHDLDLVLLDLVDERRGYWVYTDGTTMTNSVENEASGLGRVAKEQGARLVEFGEDEHFETWHRGFERLIDAIRKAGILEKSIFLDIEWARDFAGARHVFPDGQLQLGRRLRKIHRGARDAKRSLSHGANLMKALTRMCNVKPTLAEEFFDKATQANLDFIRYREVAQGMLPHTVSRRSQDLRIEPNHKWGPQPFHFRDKDYESIVESIQGMMNTPAAGSGDATNGY